MNEELKNIISRSSFQILDDIYVYCKVKTAPAIEECFMIAKDLEEITVVASLNKINSFDLIEKNKENYKLIALNVSIPFYSVGFLATISGLSPIME